MRDQDEWVIADWLADGYVMDGWMVAERWMDGGQMPNTG